MSIDQHKPICVQAVVPRKKARLNHIAFNPTHPLIIGRRDLGKGVKNENSDFCLKSSLILAVCSWRQRGPDPLTEAFAQSEEAEQGGEARSDQPGHQEGG